MATSSVPDSEIDDHFRLAVRDIPSPAKANAVRTLTERLEGKEFSPPAAASLAQAAVDPADLRRRLDRPTPVRVPGAILWTVETDVWTPMVLPYAVNYREADARLFPADDTVESPAFPPIRRPAGDPDGRPILDIDVKNRDHLVHSVENSIRYLVEHNPLTESIAERGVMFPITVVSTVVKPDEGEPLALPATADGSSRTANALEVLGLNATDVIGRFRGDPRALSGLVGQYRSLLERPLSEIPEEELGRANALILPARIVIGFESDQAGNSDFAKAIHNYVQLIHGDLPPKAWPETARIDAKADSVVTELEQAGVLTPNKARYFEGMFTPAEAAKKNYPHAADERGLSIVSVLSSTKADVRRAIRKAVIQPAENKNLSRKVRAELAAELALRGTRGSLSPKELAGARDVLADVYQVPAIWDQKLKPTLRSPQELLEAALKEREAGEEGPATGELAASGGFWLTARRTLREARFFGSQKISDSRQPRSFIAALIASEWGLRVLAGAIEHGREGDVLWYVDPQGKRVKSATGSFMPLTNDILRGEIAPPPDDSKPEDEDGPDDGEDDTPPLPERMLLDRRKRLEDAISLLEQRHDDLREVKDGSGKPLILTTGISESVTNDLRERLEYIRGQFSVYGAAWCSNSASADGEESPQQSDAEEEQA